MPTSACSTITLGTRWRASLLLPCALTTARAPVSCWLGIVDGARPNFEGQTIAAVAAASGGSRRVWLHPAVPIAKVRIVESVRRDGGITRALAGATISDPALTNA